jgi:hypothetical protein
LAAIAALRGGREQRDPFAMAMQVLGLQQRQQEAGAEQAFRERQLAETAAERLAQRGFEERRLGAAEKATSGEAAERGEAAKYRQEMLAETRAGRQAEAEERQAAKRAASEEAGRQRAAGLLKAVQMAPEDYPARTAEALMEEVYPGSQQMFGGLREKGYQEAAQKMLPGLRKMKEKERAAFAEVQPEVYKRAMAMQEKEPKTAEPAPEATSLWQRFQKAGPDLQKAIIHPAIVEAIASPIAAVTERFWPAPPPGAGWGGMRGVSRRTSPTVDDLLAAAGRSPQAGG